MDAAVSGTTRGTSAKTTAAKRKSTAAASKRRVTAAPLDSLQTLFGPPPKRRSTGRRRSRSGTPRQPPKPAVTVSPSDEYAPGLPLPYAAHAGELGHHPLYHERVEDDLGAAVAVHHHVAHVRRRDLARADGEHRVVKVLRLGPLEEEAPLALDRGHQREKA